MNIWKISIQNLKSKALYTFLSVFSLSLSIALLLGIQQLKASFQHQMENNLASIDLVIGAKGSPLQLVLASVLHLDNPTGNIPYQEALKLKKNRLVKTAVPISYGDNYKGYRIVGTTPEFLDLYNAELETGRIIEKSMEVLLGSTIAKKMKLTIGSSFLSSHGLVENNFDVHNKPFTVVGILQPTSKVIDRLIVTNLESIWNVHDHGHNEETTHHEHNENHQHDAYGETTHHEHNENQHHDAHEETKHHEHSENHQHDAHEEQEKEITSLLLSFKNPMALLTLPRKINKETNLQAALPKFELDRLYEFTGVGLKTITIIAYLILIISGLTIFISLYKMVKERAFDLALMRTYGANNTQLIQMVAYEGLIIVLMAFLLGLLLEQIGLYMIFQTVISGTQTTLQSLPITAILQTGIGVFSLIIFSILCAIFPIIKMNISTILSNEK